MEQRSQVTHHGSRLEFIGQCLAAHHTTDGEPIAQTLRNDHDIRSDPTLLDGEVGPRPSKSTLNLVDDQENPVLVTHGA